MPATKQPAELSDLQVEQLTRQLLDQIPPLRQAVLGLSGPGQGSSLAGDDRASAPYKVSHVVRRGLEAATEHLDALHALVLRAGILHPAAPMTILRATIETAATAAWVLHPSARPVRVERALGLALQDTNDQHRLERSQNLPTSRPVEDRRAAIQAVADRSLGVGTRLVQPTGTSIVTYVEEAAATEAVGLYAAWQVCSGFAHGRTWPVISVLTREEIAESDDGDVLLRTTANSRAFAWAATVAIGVTTLGIRLYGERATAAHG